MGNDDGILESKSERLERERREQNRTVERTRDYRDWWMVLLTGWLFLVGVIASYIANKNANAAISAANTADATLKQSMKAFRIDQQPYVWVGAFKVDQRQFFPDRPSSVTVYFRNAGRSPATQLSTGENSDRHCLIGAEANRVFEGPELNLATIPLSGGGLLMPGEERYFPITCPQRSLQDVVLVYGAIVYSDQFKQSHTSEYCARIVPGSLIEWCSHNNVIHDKQPSDEK